MLDVFICDKDINVTALLRNLIQKSTDDVRIVIKNSSMELLRFIEINDRIPDVLIMDIGNEESNSIDVVKSLQKIHPWIRVIYITDFICFATAIFETEPSYFLTKPLQETEMLRAIEKVFNRAKAEKKNSVLIKRNGAEIRLYHNDILYAESHGRQIFIHSIDGGIDVIYEKIDILHNQLGASFVRSHKSFLINMKYIKKRINKEFFLTNGIVLPISKPNLKEASSRFVAYCGDIREQNNI